QKASFQLREGPMVRKTHDSTELENLTYAQIQARWKAARDRLGLNKAPTPKPTNSTATLSQCILPPFSSTPTPVGKQSPKTKKVYSRKSPQDAPPLTEGQQEKVNHIVAVVARERDVDPEKMVNDGKRTKDEVALSRYLASYLIKYFMPELTYPQVALAVDRKSARQVSDDIERVKLHMVSNALLRREIWKIIGIIAQDFEALP
ncbi:MAG: hypothetical protein U1C66_00790, partial [Patescibacteria group bacterium]|nr:hypothetical protein [Patescibacteria group bacterium]